MFPYPSGKIHMGHVRNYTIGDVIARYKFLNGLMSYILWDGTLLVYQLKMLQNKIIYIPKNGQIKNIETMKKQLKMLGLSIDWDLKFLLVMKNIININKNYLLIFIIKGLISRKETYVNWDPVEKTVLANEQVINGKGWRSNAAVERKKLSQWFFNITKFSNDLLKRFR